MLSVGRESGSAGPQFNNCGGSPFCGPRDPEGSKLVAERGFPQALPLFFCR